VKRNPKLIELNQEQSKSDYFEKHPSKIQFYTNFILIVITIFTLFTTWYFSFKNLKLSTSQFKVAISEFNYQRKSDSLNSIKDSIKEKSLSAHLKNDSITQDKKDKIEVKRNNYQDQLNLRQLNINKQQLLAIKSQAKTAVNQLNEQLEQYKEQSFERKPYFMIDNVNIDSSLKYKPKISFTFTNRGIRPAHLDSTILAFYNLFKGCASVTPNAGNLDASPQQNTLNTSYINIFDDCLKSPNTIFYLIIYYRDFATDLPQSEPIFFQYHFNKQNQFQYSRLPTKVISEEFKNYLIKHKVTVFNY
jgi:hypothetical protein